MPTPAGPGSADRPPTPLLAPREATRAAMVYRQRLRQPERPSGRRIAAMVGALLVHLLVIVFIVLGPAYEPLEFPPPPEPTGDAIQLRLIERNPPPKPPAKPTPKGEAARASPRKAKSSSSANVAAARARRSTPMPPIATPDAPSVAVTPDTRVRAPAPNAQAEAKAPRKPPTAPPRQEELPPVPLPEVPPPDFAATPPTPVPVPPRFQPEPVRPPREEGNQPLPPPPSIEMPPIPAAQSQVRPEPPTLTASTNVQMPTTTIVPAAVPRPEVTASAEPPSQALAPVPDVAKRPAAPTVDVIAPRPTANIQAAPASVPQPTPNEEPDLTPVDVSTDARPTVQAPSARVKAPAAAMAIGITRPQIGQVAATDIPVAGNGATEAKGEAATPTPPTGTGDATAARQTTPTPGAADGQANTPSPDATAGTGNAPSPSTANAHGTAQGKTGLGGQAPGAPTGSILGKPGPGGAEGAMNGNPNGNPGQFIQLRPRGDTQIMSHDTNPVKYAPTRFAKDWTPEGESSIDTALRHAVEKTTVSHVFHLPRGVRVECKLMPMLPIALFGCGNPDPPAAALSDKVYERMKLAPSNPLVADLGAPVSASTGPPPRPLDNTTLCATARVAGGPPPPGCTFDAPARPLAPPPGSWVPASDQFH